MLPRMRVHPKPPLRAGLNRLPVVLGLAILLAACSTTDMVRNAQHTFDRALRKEPPSAFFGPVLARARGEAVIPEAPPQIRQHYFSIIAYLEGLTPEREEELRRTGMLGEAFVLKALAQWRLGRLDRAREATLRATASRQEALDVRERTLFHAMQGVLQIDAAWSAAKAGRDYEAIFELIGGPNGAWRALGTARRGAPRGAMLYAELLETRLAAFQILHQARSRRPADAAEPEASREAWARLRAEAQIELNEFAALETGDTARHTARVRQLQLACDLDLPVR